VSADGAEGSGAVDGRAPSRVIAIDGPSGVGKSTVARLLAARFGIVYLDSGALYRAAALKVVRAKIDPDDAEAVERLLERTRIEVSVAQGAAVVVHLDGEAVSEELRSHAVTHAASRIAAQPGVRRRLTAVQRAAVPPTGAVVEGRDIGSVVFPDTRHKFFLDARLEVRGGRRLRDEQRTRPSAALDEVVAAIGERDRRDSERSHSPLRIDDSYRVVDTSELSAEQVAAQIEVLVRAAGGI
jgi:CMP/dCMP kinase